jgi:hypothetical protein
MKCRLPNAAFRTARRPSVLLATLLVFSAALFSSAVFAHAASTAYLDVAPDGGRGIVVQWAVALRDLDAVLDLDANGDGTLTWAEVEARRADIDRTAQDALQLQAGAAPCTLAFQTLRFAQLDSGGYAVIAADAACRAAPDTVRLDYRFLQHVDATHRVLLSTPASSTPRPLAPGEQVAIRLRAEGTPGNAAAGTRVVDLGALLANGITHILGGFDHLLFLVALLLPAVLQRAGDRWVARTELKPALVDVAWIATAFTLAHSLTLALASFHIVAVPARVIEPLIALTVLAAALNNLKPVVTRRIALVAFAFGLIHGFGFAEVLAPLNLPAAQLAVALFGFNLGVEIGQLSVIAGAIALLALARRWRGYPRWVLGAGSVALALTAGIWMIERIFDVPLTTLAFMPG